MTPNTHKVPARQWKRWSENAREAFNSLYEAMQHQEFFKSQFAAPFLARNWDVARWNAAWTAASDLDEITRQGVYA